MSNTTKEATPRPWSLEVATEGEDEGLTITIPQIRRCLHDWEWADQEEWEHDLANAELIVEAVNAYDALRAENAALRAACKFCADLAEEELPYTTVGTGAEIAIRHILRNARAALKGKV